jgi:transcription antitermination factor NusG
MEIEDDEEPQWYLLNCVAGQELDLLEQCRCTCGSLLDVIKFVVPTITKTRSHGAHRMVQDTKVKYQGYVFAKLRLTRDTYLAIQSLTLCRSWMGTINVKGHRKLPPMPQPLSKEEIESFDLENFKWVQKEQEIVSTAAVKEKEMTVIVDTEEYDIEESRILDEIEEEVQTVYLGLRVEDLVKVTSKNKFYNEDGMVRRLKEGRVLIRFFTYGTVFDEWLAPSDVRKLTEDEILKGLGGPSAPITQRDLDGPRKDRGERTDQRVNFDRRNQAAAFGGGPRHRRQDRTERQFRNDRGNDDRRERDNWNWYQEQDRRTREGGYSDGEQHIRGSADQRQSRGNFWAESDVDSQWGRNNSQRNSRRDQGRSRDDERRRSQEGDRRSFVSKSSTPQKNVPPNKDEEATDNFFASLMSDLSGNVARDSNGSYDGDSDGRRSDDDFFASLMSEIDDNKIKSQSSISSRNDDNDFFASLEKESRGFTRINNNDKPTSQRKVTKSDAEERLDDIFAELSMDAAKGDTSTLSTFSNHHDDGEDDFFANLEKELSSDLGEIKKPSQSHVEGPPASDEDDFFSMLEMELASDLSKQQDNSNKPLSKASDDTPLDDDDDFFASLEKELSNDNLNQFMTEGRESDDDSINDNIHDVVISNRDKEKTRVDATMEDEEALEGKMINSALKQSQLTPVKAQDNNFFAPHHHHLDVMMDKSGLQTRTIPELKDMLREKGLKVSGKKAELIERLITATS